MATIKVKFRPSVIANREGTIFYQIIHERKVRQLFSRHHVLPEEWDEARSKVTVSENSNRKLYIRSIHELIRWDMERLARIDRRLHADGLAYTADDVIDEFNRYSREYSLFNFLEGIIASLKRKDKARTSEAYKATLNSFKKFRQEEDIMLDSITSETIEAYESWHKSRGNSMNTISFYTRILRAVYNRAVENEIIEDRNPFRHVYTGVEKTIKRALPLDAVKRIKKLDLSVYPKLDFARDIFLMSFYLRGMSFIDMAFLKKTDLKNGYITYRRHKTGQKLVIEWTAEMEDILYKYPENVTEFLLPIIRFPDRNERCAYLNMGYNINRSLKKIAELAGINIPLTLYVARHSWASAAKYIGVPISIISEGMGHDSEATTQIYLASLDTSAVDHANTRIIDSLK